MKRFLQLAAVFISVVLIFMTGVYTYSVNASGDNLFDAETTFAKGVRMGGNLVYGDGTAVFSGGAQDMYPLHSDTLYYGKFYRGDDEVVFSELGISFAAEFTIGTAGTESWHGVGLLIGNDGAAYYFFRLQTDGSCHIICWNSATNAETIVSSNYSSGLSATPGKIPLSFLRTPQKVSVYSDDAVLFDDIGIPRLGARFGLLFAFVGAGASANRLAWNISDDGIRVEKYEEPLYTEEIPEYTYNTQVIPVNTPGSGGLIAMIVCGGALILIGAASAITVFLIHKRRQNHNEKNT
ncbi:MAG: hypothetical protein LBP26_00330 [Clostridiales bacterium]|jgi:hypothetical protein|nr:hypothetical protein [Clostridiales bacterium]